MTKHSFILSSAGLKNIILSSEYRKINQDPLDEELDQFSFIIYQKEIKMNRFFCRISITKSFTYPSFRSNYKCNLYK